MPSATTHKVVDTLRPARRVPDMRSAAVNTSVTAKPIRPLYERLHRSTSSRTKPSVISVVSRQNKLAPRVQASRTKQSASALRITKLLAHARADYEQNDENTLAKTKIPRPTIVATKHASVRRRSELWARMSSVVIRRAKEITSHESAEETNVIGRQQKECEETDSNDVDSTSLIFDDNSFDESVSPDQQTTELNMLGRTLVSMKRLDLGLRIHRSPWFVGLARFPSYVGDDVVMPRVRPRTRMTIECEKQGMLESASERSILPLDSEQSIRANAIKNPTRDRTTKAATTKASTPAKGLKANPTPTEGRQGNGRRNHLRTTKPGGWKSLSRKSSSAPPVRRRRSLSKTKATLVRKPVPNMNSAAREPVPRPAKSKKPTQQPVSRQKQDVNPSVKSAIRRTDSIASTKTQVTFLEGPIKPRFYAHDDSIKYSTIAVGEPESTLEWEPLANLSRPQKSFTGTGLMQLFERTSTGCLTLRRRFLNRYVSVQPYEAHRRKEAVANGEQPGLGQLEYGNADFKIALQASKTIEAHHIGMLQDLSAIGKAGVPLASQERMTNPVLIFGSFKEPYEPASVPVKPVAANKGRCAGRSQDPRGVVRSPREQVSEGPSIRACDPLDKDRASKI
ncbi:hypothetical protein DDE83_002800 [Stemphylium lycopersici]|uniref:Uncharacterized protein n=1 Tax=Stemphylium lycopersici TaxID=183478 RepID=A0A364N9C6_STELY|nr:hypothetical protein DDE83_002800 [Stemphylium lycopersici]